MARIKVKGENVLTVIVTLSHLTMVFPLCTCVNKKH